MPTTACRRCEAEIPIGALVCPACGWKQESPAERRTGIGRGVLALFLLAAVVVIWAVAMHLRG